MWSRALEPLVRRRLEDGPALAIVGPRQAGKTSLAKMLGGRYFDLEVPADRLALDLSFRDLAAGHELVVLDEAQAFPEVFPLLRSAIDRDRSRNGRFLLLGSVSPRLMSEVSESLVGRLSLVELTPFTSNELPHVDLDTRWLRGGYPDGGVLGQDRFPTWQLDYLELLAQRDLPAWGLPAKPEVTMRLLRMAAAVHGQLWNASAVGRSLGLTHPTVNSYLDFLAGAFLLRRLEPWLANQTKRLTKTPKLLWRDTGLLHALQLVSDRADLLSRPWVGASWEGFVVEEALAVLLQLGVPFRPFFFRTSDGYEIDLVLDLGRERWAVEVKLTAHPSQNDMARLAKTADMVGATRRFLVTRSPEVVESGPSVACDLPAFLRHVASLAAAAGHAHRS